MEFQSAILHALVITIITLRMEAVCRIAVQVLEMSLERCSVMAGVIMFWITIIGINHVLLDVLHLWFRLQRLELCFSAIILVLLLMRLLER